MKRIDELAITIGIVFLHIGLELNINVTIGILLTVLGIVNRVTK